ncbi:MAG: hypothetical protein EBU90_06350 [Proteobacteria bacterium]|nr:hypothetical protein [Pseudomonadota bacterium]NBP16799.1 hypothetical protein [bacterium]
MKNSKKKFLLLQLIFSFASITAFPRPAVLQNDTDRSFKVKDKQGSFILGPHKGCILNATQETVTITPIDPEDGSCCDAESYNVTLKPGLAFVIKKK